MQAKEIYGLCCRAYNGDEAARAEWLALLAPLAQKAALPYGVLPGVILARAALESGWGSDLYEKVMERKFGVWFASKAQNHNNMVGMVAYGRNDEYCKELPAPVWAGYKGVFDDYAPHGDMSGSYSLARETWKDYRNVEDCFEDFAAVLRAQAARRKEPWPSDLRGQLLSIGRGYTPEGAASKAGMVYEWQDRTLELHEKYGLWKYDLEVMVMAKDTKITTEALDGHIVQAYKYAHAYCSYGRTDTHYPPGEGEDHCLDCVGLVYRALYTMGLYPHALNINQVVDLCLGLGMKKSTGINDVWRHHGVVCMQDVHLAGTQHVSHVYYSLGGTDVKNISKYDLGSGDRIKAEQPFKPVPVNEWEGKRNFLCILYVDDKQPDTKRKAVPGYSVGQEFVGVISKDVGMYDGPGTAWKKLKKLKAGTDVRYGLSVTNDKGNDWRRVRTESGEVGYVCARAVVAKATFDTYKGKITQTADGFAALRVGAGTGCFRTGKLASGTVVKVDGDACDAGGLRWLHVVSGKLRGYVAEGLVVAV